jgi:hypothetical protein
MIAAAPLFRSAALCGTNRRAEQNPAYRPVRHSSDRPLYINSLGENARRSFSGQLSGPKRATSPQPLSENFDSAFPPKRPCLQYQVRRADLPDHPPILGYLRCSFVTRIYPTMLIDESIRDVTRKLESDQRSAAPSPSQTQPQTLKETESPRFKWYDQIFAAGAVVFMVVALAFVYLFGSRQRVDELTKKLSRGQTGRQC